MGIRMHVCMGYGLDLSQFGGADTARLRDHEALESEEVIGAFYDELTAWAIEHDLREELFGLVSRGEQVLHDLSDLTVYDDEFGLEDKLLLVPAPSRKSWHSYNDDILCALYEAQNDPNDPNWMSPEWVEKPGTLYPYIGLMKANPEKPLGIEKYWVPCYRDHPRHKDAIAWAPWHLWFLIKHLRLWPEERTSEAFLSLRPTIYRYWS